MKEKIVEWRNRYLLPVALGTIAAIVAGTVSHGLTGNKAISAVVATAADALVGYGVILFRDATATKRVGFVKIVRNMLIEFGPAEYLDSFIIRPFYFFIFPYIILNYSFAILVGSLLAEITYFLFVIIGYETRKKLFKG